MRSRKTIEEWHHAPTTLKKSAADFTSLEKKVLSLLEFSFDSLPDDATKSCFLYCALYPEDWFLDIANLINSWAGEGFLDQSDDLNEAYYKGRHIIGTLKLACLLESAELVGDNYIKMHDLALWVISDKGTTKGKFLVRVGLKLTKAPPFSEWERAERISLISNSIDQLKGAPRCPNLLTLLLQWNALKMISDGFFEYMHSLQVVDLSYNKSLAELPTSFFYLLSLRHLDLSFSGIRLLPQEFKKLTKLKYLYLNNMDKLQIIPQQVLSNLSMLKRLDLFNSGISDQVLDGNVFCGGNELLMDELECLENLQALSFTVKSENALQKFLRSDKLQKDTYGLDIELCRATTTLRLRSDTTLSWIQIGNCSDLKELAIDWLEEEGQDHVVPGQNPRNTRNLRLRGRCLVHLGSLIIKNCKGLVHLNWLIYVPNLKSLEIANWETTELISDDDEITEQESWVFRSLQKLILHDLPQLESICSHPLSFPSLRQIHVFDCPRLTKLPFHANSDKQWLHTISGQEAWWNALEWEDMTLKSIFSPYFWDSQAGP